MKSLKEILTYSPHKELREIQIQAVESVYNMIKDKPEKKFFILELPTGTGKSCIGWILAHAFDTGYFITIQKLLQDQYVREMGNKMAILKGQNAYQCKHHNEYTCENSVCATKPFIRKKHNAECPYVLAVDNALASDFSMFNAHSFYFQFKYGKFKGLSRDILIVDEGHLIESAYMSIIETVLIENDVVKDIPSFNNVKDYVPYMTELQNNICKIIEEEGGDDQEEGSDYVSTDIVKRLIKLRKLSNKLVVLLDDIKSGSEWVHQIENRNDGRRRVVFKPVFVNAFITSSLYSCASKVIIMSATIGSFREFCARSGIRKEEAIIVRGSSPFPVENRLIKYEGQGKMSRKHFEANFSKLIKRIKEILEEYKNERGIIHTHSEWLASRIVNELKDDRVTVKNGNVIAMLKTHESKSNSVIVAAGLATGLDLKNDLARFAIIPKMPYPSLGDIQIKRRTELSQEYYNHLTALNIVQAYGRTVRNVDDYAMTFILDSDFGSYKHFNKKHLPEWFLEAIVNE